MRAKWILVSTLFAVLAITASVLTAAPIPLRVAEAASARSLAPTLPLWFEENRGQFRAGVDFAGRAGDDVFEISATSSTFSTGRTECGDAGAAIAMRLLDSNANAMAEGEEPTPTRISYFIGSDRSKWVGGASTYGQVRYKGVYPGIDVVYHSSSERIEYDFVVEPNADPRAVRLSFDGGRPRITPSGDLVVSGTAAEVVHKAPRAYQVRNGVREPIETKFALDHGVATFRVGRYDRSLPLVIDPVLVFSRYLFFSNEDRARGVEVDASGNIYVMGTAEMPPTVGFGASHSPSRSVFVAKFDPSGTTPAYIVYIGTDWDSPVPTALAIDGSGNAYVTGISAMPHFPTTAGAFDEYEPGSESSVSSGYSYSFVTKINSSGTALVYSTLFGWDCTINDIAVDSAGNAYVTGEGGQIPITPGALQHTDTDTDAFVAKLDPSGATLLYSARFGGGFSESGCAIAIDGAGNAIVAGLTDSVSCDGCDPFPTTAGSYIPSNSNIFAYRAFISKLNSSGTAFIFSSYFYSNQSWNGDVALDAEGNIWVAGTAGFGSAAFPATAGAYSVTPSDLGDIYIARMDPTGTTIQYGTLLGGSWADIPRSLRIDPNGHVIIVGEANSSDYPLVQPIQQVTHGYGDWFISKFNPTLSTLEFSTFLGPADEPHSALTPTGDVILVGNAQENFWIRNHPVPPGLESGYWQAVLSKISFSGSQPFGIDCRYPIGGPGGEYNYNAVRLRGSGFQQGATILLDGVPIAARDTAVGLDGTSAVLTTPTGHALGSTTITLRNPGGAISTSPEAYEFNDPPIITNISPSTGTRSGGTPITITGSGFKPGAHVRVYYELASNVSVTPNSITCTTPISSGIGSYEVQVFNPDGQSASVLNSFTYTSPTSPTISATAPVEGPAEGGTSVTIDGTNFAVGARVQFGGYWSKYVTRNSANQLVAIAPPHRAGTVDVRVYNPEQAVGESANAYTYRGIALVDPASGFIEGGTNVTITGKRFAAGDIVYFDGVAATGVTFVDSNKITASTPAHAAGFVDVTISGAGHELYTLANGFRYWEHPPRINSVYPNVGSCAGGDAVSISGSAFQSGATVKIGDAFATNVVVSDTLITCNTPAHAAGKVDVVVTNPDTQASMAYQAFTYTGISAVVPAQGRAGDTIVVNGQGFKSGATVTFGGVAGSFSFVNSTQLSGVAPAHAPGLVDVVVTNPDSETFTKTNAFTYLYPVPTVTSVTPNSGPTSGGTVITITGTNFVNGTTVKIGSVAATSVTVDSATQITCTTPAQSAGTYGITVTLPDAQTAYLGSVFTYNGPPSISSLSPSTGPMTGGTAVTINGTSFANGAQVKFGATAATGITVTGSTQITCATPAGTVGPVDVTVTNTDGQSGTKASAFSYLGPAPTVTGVTPTNGPKSGGTVITITGTNFVNGATVQVGSVAATNVTVGSSTQIIATTPAQPAGTYGVTVTLPDTQSASLASVFTYYEAPPAPTIASFAPTGAPPGATVVITGTNFVDVTGVSFGGTPASSYTVDSATQITVIIPNGAVTGPISVTTPGGTATSAMIMSIFPGPPVIVSVTPARGSLGGGTIVTISGWSFRPGARVTFGATAATVEILTSTSITVDSPPHAEGVVDITVKNLDWTTETKPSAYAYTKPFDPNGDSKVTPSDIVYLINYLFARGNPPIGSGDANGDSATNILDVFYLVNYLFGMGPGPV